MIPLWTDNCCNTIAQSKSELTQFCDRTKSFKMEQVGCQNQKPTIRFQIQKIIFNLFQN